MAVAVVDGGGLPYGTAPLCPYGFATFVSLHLNHLASADLDQIAVLFGLIFALRSNV